MTHLYKLSYHLDRMKIIIGLGNPGIEYSLTRHNAGAMLVDKLGEKFASESSYGWRRKNSVMMWESSNLVLVKSGEIFMNESGRMVHELSYTKYNPKDIWVAHDDLDLRLGEFKMQMGKGPKVHNGVESIENAMGTRDFQRIRIGIDNRDTNNREDGEKYVLQRFVKTELHLLETTLESICDRIF